jgi:hypothetical protein
LIFIDELRDLSTFASMIFNLSKIFNVSKNIKRLRRNFARALLRFHEAPFSGFPYAVVNGYAVTGNYVVARACRTTRNGTTSIGTLAPRAQA